jgi:class 3 adenylate cyclase/tetratricopeptide (TPR) repeat protein
MERKVVTCLFCDLVGFTARAERLDPEDVRALLSPYHARVRSELERFGGTVEKFIGDAVMALYGAPVAHEDAPERAVRAALAIREWAAEQGEDLQVRIGVNTGEALVTLGARPSEGESMAAGDVVNTAARLQAAAPLNGVLVGEQTHSATVPTIDYREAGAVVGKGKEKPISVWEALGVRTDLVDPTLAPLVGRRRELGLLVSTLERVRDECSPELVTLLGVPGIGKTRLLRELVRIAEGGSTTVTVRRGRSLPYGEGVSFWALAEIVKSQAGVLENDAAEQVSEKLRDAVSGVVPDPAEALWVERQLRPLVGLADETSTSLEEAFAAWRRFVEAVADEKPLVLVFEDLHWADDALLDFVDELVERSSGVPLFVLATARPELLERRPDWGGGKSNALTVSLSPLSDDDTARLLSALLERPLLDADTQAVLLARAGGNPLYAEQYARILFERGDVQALPETVQGIIAARLDALSDAEKRVLQDAAVVGKAFWRGAVEAVQGVAHSQAGELLHSLERKEFVQRARRSSVAGETEYSFRHVLIREVAYGQIPRAARAEKHRRAAAWIQSLGRPEDHAEVIAHHYLAALELLRAAGQESQSLEAQARIALRDAGDRAMGLNAYATAVAFYDKALELWPADDPDRAELLFRLAKAEFQIDNRPLESLLESLAALLASGEAERAAEAETLLAIGFHCVGDSKRSLEHTAQAAARLETAPPSRAKAFVLANRARFLTMNGFMAEGIASAQEALGMAEELELDELRASALHAIGLARLWRDDFGGIDDLEESLRLMLAHGSPFEICRIYLNVGVAYEMVGRNDRAVELLRLRQEIADRFGLRRVTVLGAGLLGFHAFLAGHWDEAERLAGEHVADEGDDFAWMLVTWVGGLIHAARDDPADAAAACDRIVKFYRANDDHYGLALSLAFRARVALVLGERDAALAIGNELAALAPEALDEAQMSVEILELFAGLHDLGRPLDVFIGAAAARPQRVWLQPMATAARGELAAAADMLGELGVKSYEAYMRLRAAERLVAEGRRAEADVQLGKAFAFYRSVGATAFVRECEALLAASA